jgi:protein MpaA
VRTAAPIGALHGVALLGVALLGVALLGVALLAGCGSSAPRPRAPTNRPPRSSSPRGSSVGDPATVDTSTLRLGVSERGRPIVVVRAGDPRGTPVLVVGCIHGNECAGIAVARALERARVRADLWIVPDLNPDGHARGTRQDDRGVDLNANWPSQWHRGGRPWDVYYPGPRPFSERETRLARGLILRIRPRVTIWYHQHMNLVWAWGPSSAAGRVYARAAGMRFYHRPWLDGTAANWQNHRLPGASAFTVELPAGRLSPQQTRRQMSAVLRVAVAASAPAAR